MKKIIFRIIMGVLALGLVFSGIILYSEKVHTLAFVENIKKALGEPNETRAAYTVTNAAKVDVTYLEDNASIGHEHTFKTMYDENKHWEECTICGEKDKEEVHTYKTTWALGKESCINNNSYISACDCGYSYTGHKPCVWKGGYSTYVSGSHYKKCSICNNRIYYCYYKNNYGVGKIYDDVLQEKCVSSTGVVLQCGNTGTCAKCKYYHSSGGYHQWGESDDGELICVLCNTKYGYISNKNVTISDDEPFTNTYTFDITAYKKSTVETVKDQELWISNISDLFSNCSQTITYLDSTKYRVTTVLKSKKGKIIDDSDLRIKWKAMNGTTNGYGRIFINYTAENIPPTVEVESDVELTEWSKTKPITVTGTENYCSNVSVKILDDKENIIFEGMANVNNGNYSISCVPLLEIDTNGRTFKVIVTDMFENTTEKEFKIAKVDAIPPIAISSDDITGQWSKSRKFTFKATDGGSGEVQIAFNDIGDLALANFDGNEYIRDYEFYGDVYSPKQLSVLYRDKLGNTSIQKITINNLDNTAPTITKASIHNNVVNIISNDEHATLGQGSGVVKYRYITSSEKLDNPNVSNGIEIDANEKMVIDDVYNVKYIYIVAEDVARNVSEVYELKVPELILTSSVDLSLSNGKGGIILDWSSYDVSDKYFVVYRKEENATDWETIVSLDEKLTGSTYTDILGNDKAKPDVPNINITGDAQNNNIKIEATSSDNGTKYSYYIKAYDMNDVAILLDISNKI